MNKSEQLNELGTALAKAQREIKGAVKDTVNGFLKNKYADLESTWNACRDALNANGLSVIQTVGGTKEAPTLTTILLHGSGQFISDEQPLFMKDQSGQALGSATSYARRYGLAAIAGVVQTDDDGEGAMNRQNQGNASGPKPQGPRY